MKKLIPHAETFPLSYKKTAAFRWMLGLFLLFSGFSKQSLAQNGPVCNTFTNLSATVPTGLGDINVNDVFVSGNMVYAATTHGLSISTNGGATFTNKTKKDGVGFQVNSGSFVNSVYVDGSTIYAAMGLSDGLAISTDGGASFTSNSLNGLWSSTINSVYASGNSIYAATENGLGISTNGGDWFDNRTTGIGLGNNFVRDVYVDGSIIYAATDGGLGISTNGGATFTNKTTTNGLGSNAVFGVYASGNMVYAATAGGLSISTDGGASFTNKTTADGLGSNFVRKVFTSGTMVYAATNGGLSISTDGGASFTNKTTANGLGDNTILGLYAVGNSIYTANYYGGLSISNDGGTSFTTIKPTKPSGNGLVANTIAKVFASGNNIYAVESNGLSISSDGGASFTNKTTANGLGSNAVWGVYASGTMLYAATNGGLSISTDGGATFTNKTTANGLGSNSVMWVFASGSNVYAATDGGLSISTDGGASFTNKTTTNGLGNDWVTCVYASGSNVYAGTAGGVSISTDGGNSFTNKTYLDGLETDYINCIYAIGSNVYAGTDAGLSISTDGGASFTNTPPNSNGLGNGYVRGVFAYGTTVYVALYYGGVSISTDGGATFSNYTSANGLGSDLVYGVYASNSKIYVATNDGLSLCSGNSNCTPSSSTDTISACGSYTWHGTTYTSSNNTATWTRKNEAGCDSVVTLNLIIKNPTSSTETISACGSYTWHETTYTSSNNTATWKGTNAEGCDSVVTLNLTIILQSSWYKDNDGDGYGDPNNSILDCTQPLGYVTNSRDCNDGNNSIGPKFWYKDKDGDGYGSKKEQDKRESCNKPAPEGFLPGDFVENYDDCNDDDASIGNTVWYKDTDNDGYGTGDSIYVCDQPTGYRLLKDMTSAFGDCDDTNANIRPNSSTAATSATASIANPAPGTSIKLRQIGGVLGSSDNWKWYSGSCGGTLVGSGDSITVAPTVTTTYFVRAEGCTNTNCVAVIVSMCGPTTVSSKAVNNSICLGSSVELNVQGTLVGTAKWVWYKTACGNISTIGKSEGVIGTGATLKVTPSVTTTYYVRSEGGSCGNSSCKSITITVNQKPVKPTSVSLPSIICKQATTNFIVGDVKNATSYKWTVPLGWSILSGQGTKIITVQTSNVSGDVKVAAANSCGTSEAYTKIVALAKCTGGSTTVGLTNESKIQATAQEESNAVIDINAFPNPTANYFTIRNNNPFTIQLRMMQTTGRVVETYAQVKPGESVKFGSSYKPGVYLIEAFGNGMKTTKKLIIQ